MDDKWEIMREIEDHCWANVQRLKALMQVQGLWIQTDKAGDWGTRIKMFSAQASCNDGVQDLLEHMEQRC